MTIDSQTANAIKEARTAYSYVAHNPHVRTLDKEVLGEFIDRAQVLELGRVWDNCPVNPALYYFFHSKALRETYRKASPIQHVLHRGKYLDTHYDLTQPLQEAAVGQILDVVTAVRGIEDAISPAVNAHLSQPGTVPQEAYTQLIEWIAEMEINQVADREIDRYHDLSKQDFRLHNPFMAHAGFVKYCTQKSIEYFRKHQPQDGEDDSLKTAHKLVKEVFTFITEDRLAQEYSTERDTEWRKIIEAFWIELHTIERAISHFPKFNGNGRHHNG